MTIAAANSKYFQKGTLATLNDVVAIAGILSATYIGIYLDDGGTWTGTVTFEATNDGTNWFAVNVTPAASATGVSTATAKGGWSIIMVWQSFRVRLSTAGANTATITLRARPMGDR